VLTLLREGRSVFFMDADMTLLANPLAYLPRGYDFYLQDDVLDLPWRFNSGFFFARSGSAAVEAVFEDMRDYVTRTPLTGHGSTQQIGFNWAVQRRLRRGLRAHLLDSLLFPNGRAFFEHASWRTRVVPVAVHHNFARSAAVKLLRARRHGLYVERPDLPSLLTNFSTALFERASDASMTHVSPPRAAEKRAKKDKKAKAKDDRLAGRPSS